MSMMPKWIAEGMKHTKPLTEEGIDWLRSRPHKVQLLLKLFPPNCVIKFLANACCDVWEGTLAVVVAYNEDGSLVVITDDPPKMTHRVPAIFAEFVTHSGELTRERIKEVLDDA